MAWGRGGMSVLLRSWNTVSFSFDVAGAEALAAWAIRDEKNIGSRVTEILEAVVKGKA